MSMSRRSVIASALAATAAIGGVTAASQAGAAEPRRRSAFGPAASPAGDVVGKITVGYQGWFACKGDGAPINSWWHWSQNAGQPPSPDNTTLVSWPDMREYDHSYVTAYGDLGSGQPAALFSSWDQQTVDTHFRWMRENDCDTAALQRFNPFGDEGPTRDAMTQKVRQAAEANGRKFYIMYDVSGWTSMQQQIKDDWTSKMKAYTASSAYARQNGKP
ncbi:xylosidase, partial [Streptomyces sp. NPDC088725]